MPDTPAAPDVPGDVPGDAPDVLGTTSDLPGDAPAPDSSAPDSTAPDSTARSATHRRTAWWVPVLAVGIAVLGATGTYLGAGYVAHTVRNDHIAKSLVIEQRVDDAVGDLKAAITRADSAGQNGAAITAIAVDGLGTADLAGVLEAASATATELAATEVATTPEPIAYDQSAVRPAWVSVVEILETRERAEVLDDELDDLTAAAAETAAAAATADAARVAFYASAAENAAALLAANQVATYETRIAVQHGIDQSGDDWLEARDSSGAYRQLAEAVGAMQASAGAEQARRAEADYAARGPIEDFARSIAHGVNLDFVWANVVAGKSSDDNWYAGTALYRYGDGGWATIELSHSIGWHFTDDINAKAVVVHEVGHAQVVRPECEPLYSGPVFNGDDEMWATAWAIASGYDVDGSGIQAYGRPSDAQIAEAAKCI
ncbi:hypothetical protein [Agromyces aureus]|uniref:Uncharacterized protein n=1 Tax=Agromyces aureus TaxID=453304 RepID=A0A191WJ65_9MICO|nr:hypothetical protein [Agromyces aureus]ANJ28213.1 hypothetical protein ATC03_17385 [Agromyces aureus]